MTNYTPSDFTDIRGPEEKPTVPGFYPSTAFLIKSLVALKNGSYVDYPYAIWFDYFDGETWWHYNKRKKHFYPYQSRYWFGLKERP